MATSQPATSIEALNARSTKFSSQQQQHIDHIESSSLKTIITMESHEAPVVVGGAAVNGTHQLISTGDNVNNVAQMIAKCSINSINSQPTNGNGIVAATIINNFQTTPIVEAIVSSFGAQSIIEADHLQQQQPAKKSVSQQTVNTSTCECQTIASSIMNVAHTKLAVGIDNESACVDQSMADHQSPVKMMPMPNGQQQQQQQSRANHSKSSLVGDCLLKPTGIRSRANEIGRSWANIQASAGARQTINPIREVIEIMNLEPNPDKEMIPLSIGDPTVFGNLQPCPEIFNAMYDSMSSGQNIGYQTAAGMQRARQAVADYHNQSTGNLVTFKDVILTSGCSHALDLAICVLASSGDNILIPKPGFPIYKTLTSVYGVHYKQYDLIADKNWTIDFAHLESLIDNKTAAIVINNPSNPCGSVFSRQELLNILHVAQKYCLPIIADEIYDKFVFDNINNNDDSETQTSFVAISTLTNQVPVLTCGGISKTCLIPGLRLGWVIINDPAQVFESSVRGCLNRLTQRLMGPSSIVQGALPDILTLVPSSFYSKTIEFVKNNALICYDRLKTVPGLHPFMPAGAMYLMCRIETDYFKPMSFADDLEFTSKLVNEQSVLVLPGRCFDFPNYFRICLTVPVAVMQEAMDRIEIFCRHYQRIPLSAIPGTTLNNYDRLNAKIGLESSLKQLTPPTTQSNVNSSQAGENAPPVMTT